MSEPAVWVESPDQRFDYFQDWKECIDNTMPGGGGASSRNSQEETLTGIIPFEQSVSAEAYFLGWSYADSGAPYRLYRNLPARHPRKPQLYAYTTSVVGMVPRSNPDNPNGEPYQLSEFLGTDDEDMYYADYEKAIMTVRFKSFGRTWFAPDSAIDDPPYLNEWKRFTIFDGKPQVQTLNADGTSNLKFAEGSTAPATSGGAWTGNPTGQPFPAPIAQLLAKINFSVTWLDVPHEYLSENLYFLEPTKIIERLGTINEDTMFDICLPGTMLLLSVAFEPVLFPVIPINTNESVTGWNVTFNFEKFDPPKGAKRELSGVVIEESEYRGHRIYPWRNDGLYYYAFRENGASELLPLTTMMKVFQNVRDDS